MKAARIVGIVTAMVVVGSGVALWMTWDSTQTAPSQSVGRPMELSARDGAGTLTTSVTEPEPEVPACAAGDDPVEGDPVTDWATLVVDPAHRLPSSFVPPDLVDISAAGFEANGDTVRELLVPDLTAMREAAEANGTPFIVVSAYRSYEYQQQLFEQRVQQLGEDEAMTTTAMPGHSEHQLGTTIDVLDPPSTELDETFATTPAGRWIAAHSHEYGFVLSYPDDALDHTCYDFEPWHLRYVGRDIAQRIHDSGRTPREWMLYQGESLR